MAKKRKTLPKRITMGDLVSRIIRDCDDYNESDRKFLMRHDVDDLIIIYYTYQN